MRDRLSLTLTDAANGNIIQDFTGIAMGIVATSDAHGFTGLNFTVPYFPRYKNQRAIIGAIATLGTGIDIVWEGRVEDTVIQNDATMNIVCTGRWAATADYTIPSSTYSVAGYDLWDVLRRQQYSNAYPNKWGMSNHEGLYFTPKRDVTFAAGAGDDFGIMYFVLPDDDTEAIVEIEFDYLVTLEDDWYIQCQSWSTPMTGADAPGWTLGGNGTTQSGTGQTVTFSNKQAISFTCYYNGESSFANTFDEDDHYALITNIVVRTIQDPILPNDIVEDLIGQASNVSLSEKYISSTNSIGVSSSTDYILSVEGATSMDIGDIRFENTTLQEALQFLANMGNLDGEHVSTGIWEDGKIFFWLTDDWNTTWYVNASDVTFNESFEDMVNSVSVQYRDGNMNKVRKDNLTNQASIEAFGIEKQIILDIDSKCDCVATSLQETVLSQFAFPPPRIKMALGDAQNSGYWRIRPNDYVVVQNVAFDIPEETVRFRVEKISYDVSGRSISVEPLFNPGDPDNSKTILQHYEEIASILPKSSRVEVSV